MSGEFTETLKPGAPQRVFNESRDAHRELLDTLNGPGRLVNDPDKAILVRLCGYSGRADDLVCG